MRIPLLFPVLTLFACMAETEPPRDVMDSTDAKKITKPQPEIALVATGVAIRKQ